MRSICDNMNGDESRMMDELVRPIFSLRARAFYAGAFMLRCLPLAYEGRTRGLLSNDLNERS